jgi:NADH:ubiquinone oxidoreductase subunit F (NADH-binding)
MTSGRISEAIRGRVRAHAGNCCGYCLSRQDYVPWQLEIEHIIPKAKGGTDDEENLWLACRSCKWSLSLCAEIGSRPAGIHPRIDWRRRWFDQRRELRCCAMILPCRHS